MSYHQFGTVPDLHGSFEVFFAFKGDRSDPPDGKDCPQGWYWWPCFPGCLPDGDAVGPFETEIAAINDANAHEPA